jgi:required for meiotic nuclear division protein 1
MHSYSFEARTVGRSVDLNRLSGHFGLRHRYTWEEPLCLDSGRLRGILREPEGRSAWVFSFGAVVFTNCQPHEIHDILAYLARHEPALAPGQNATFQDTYALAVSELEIGPDSDQMTVAQFEAWQPEILATVLAKSVALERVEASLDVALDRFEERLERLEKGRLVTNDMILAQDAARILRLEHDSISYLGILDKPDLTWDNAPAEKLYSTLSRQFELKDRNDAVRRKSEVLKDINGTFSDLAHARRSTRLEWIIILLIAFEILMALFSPLWKFLTQ